MKYHTYVLRSLKDGKLYVGSTANLERRLCEHREGGVVSTRNRRPLELVYSEEFNEKGLSVKREKFFKTGKGRQALPNLIEASKQAFMVA